MATSAGTANFQPAYPSTRTRGRTPDIGAASRVLVLCLRDGRAFRGGEGSGLMLMVVFGDVGREVEEAVVRAILVYLFSRTGILVTTISNPQAAYTSRTQTEMDPCGLTLLNDTFICHSNTIQ
jgi:hypothetical protein